MYFFISMKKTKKNKEVIAVKVRIEGAEIERDSSGWMTKFNFLTCLVATRILNNPLSYTFVV